MLYFSQANVVVQQYALDVWSQAGKPEKARFEASSLVIVLTLAAVAAIFQYNKPGEKWSFDTGESPIVQRAGRQVLPVDICTTTKPTITEQEHSYAMAASTAWKVASVLRR